MGLRVQQLVKGFIKTPALNDIEAAKTIKTIPEMSAQIWPISFAMLILFMEGMLLLPDTPPSVPRGYRTKDLLLDPSLREADLIEHLATDTNGTTAGRDSLDDRRKKEKPPLWVKGHDSVTGIDNHRSTRSRIFIPSLGLMMEPSGDVVTYDGFLYLPIVHHVPSLRSILRPALLCRHDKLTDQMVKSYQSYLDNMIPSFSIETEMHRWFIEKSEIGRTPGREKRFLGVILSLLGGTMSLWNRVSVSNVEDKISSLTSYISENRGRLNQLSSVILEQHRSQEQIIRSVNNLVRQISKAQQVMNCSLEELQYFTKSAIELTTTVPVGFVRAVEWALQGRLSFDLLPLKDLSVILRKHREMDRTIYRSFPALVYELSSFLVTEISRDPPMVSGIIILPRITLSVSSKIYSVGSVSYMSGDYLQKLEVPTSIVLDNKLKVLWKVDPVECRVGPSLVTCPSSLVMRQVDRCLTNVYFKNKLVGCKLLVRPVSDEFNDVIQFQSGVLIGSKPKNFKIIKVGSDRDIEVQSKNISSNSVSFFDSNDGDHIVLENDVYPLILQREEFDQITIHLNTSWGYQIPMFDLTLLENDWTPVGTLAKLDDVRDPSTPTRFYVATSIFSIVLTLLVVLIIWCYRYQRSSHNRSKMRMELLADRLNLKRIKYDPSDQVPEDE